jgi:hypothetical protein
MSNAWSAKDIALSSPISGVVTKLPVSKEASVSASGSRNGIIKLSYSGVTQVGTITPILQTAIGADWVDVKSGSAITASGIQYIRWNVEASGDQSVLPLLNKLRVVVSTTNAGDAILVSSIELLQGL